jgi:hypothetical protein
MGIHFKLWKVQINSEQYYIKYSRWNNMDYLGMQFICLISYTFKRYYYLHSFGLYIINYKQWRHIANDSTLHADRCETFKSNPGSMSFP